MAESFVPADLCEDLICCVICYEHFSEERVPKALPCLHTFCEGCLKGAIVAYQKNVLKQKRATASGDFPCPVCKGVTKVPENGMAGFKNDFRIQKITEILEKTRFASPVTTSKIEPKNKMNRSGIDKICEVCKFFSKESMATLYCMECNKLLCNSCADKHKSTPIAKNHNLVDAGDMLPSESGCSEHQGESVQFFCQECSQALCPTCTFTDEHSNHQVVQLNEEKERVTTKLRELLDACKASEPQLREALGQHERYELKLREKEKAAHKAILMRTIEEIGKIRREQARMELDLENICRSKYHDLQNGRRALDKHQSESNEYRQLVSTILERGQIIQIVSGFADMQSKLQSLRAFSPKPLPEQDKFVELGRYDNLAEQYDESAEKEEGASRNSIIAEIKNVASQMKLFSVGRADLKVELVAKVGRKGSKEGEFNFPSSVAIFPNGDIAIADLHNSRVQIFDRDGKYKRKFGHEGFKPCGITITREGHIAVTDTKNLVNCIKVFTVEGIRRGSIGKGQFDYPFSLDVDSNGRFVVSDPARNQIVILRHDGSLDTRFDTRTKFAFYINVSYKDEIVVSDWYQHCVRVFDSTGMLLRKIGTRGSGDGELLIPLGLCTDPRGTILILDCKNQRIAMFADTGQFIKHLLTGKQEGLEFSRAIALSRDGRLVITHGDNKRDIPNELRIYQI